VAQTKYTPFGDRVDLAVAIVQAASALDVAARYAMEAKDSSAMIKVAHGWVELSEHLVYDGEDDEDEELEQQEAERSKSFGFSVVSDIEGEEEIDGTDAD
jgi:hypothetical protein